MNRAVAAPVFGQITQRASWLRGRVFGVGLVTGLTVLAVGVHGYHPYAEDGGLYIPEIKRLLDPSLYPYGSEFVAGPLRFSLFAPMVAGLVRLSHLSVEMVLLLLQVASLWGTLFAAWLLVARCYAGREARCGAVALLAVWMTLPIAGTSLLLMDPYVTARSLSTPCVLLALVGVVEFRLSRVARWRGLVLAGGALAFAMAMHPLMGGYGLAAAMVLCLVMSPARRIRVWGTVGLCVAGVTLAAVVQWLAAPESADYLRAELTRQCWFLSEWQWYEWLGLAAPLGILAVAGFRARHESDTARAGLAQMAVAAGLVSVVIAMLFARVGLAAHLVARLQPLRMFQVVYLVMILMVGGWVGERLLQRKPWRWVAVFVLLASVMVVAERKTFPSSDHLELPWSLLRNRWENAFMWIRRNTPKDALFALDANYITATGEDAQGFRAMAERSVLPDYTKDGGIAADHPELSAAWFSGLTAQTELNAKTDAERIASLRPLGVTWVVLNRSADTQFDCAYANDAVKVCRLP